MSSAQSSERQEHLTKETLLRCQMGAGSEDEHAHLEMCSACRAQTQPMAEALGWFGAAARQWGEEKAAATAQWRRSPAAQEWREARVKASRRWPAMTASWAAACGVLLLIFGLGGGLGLPRWQAHRATLAAQARQQEAQRELARDNALLEAVDQDVSRSVPAAFAPLSWSTPTSTNSATDKTQLRQ